MEGFRTELVEKLKVVAPAPVRIAPAGVAAFRDALAADLRARAPIPIAVLPTLAPGSKAALETELAALEILIPTAVAPTVAPVAAAEAAAAVPIKPVGIAAFRDALIADLKARAPVPVEVLPALAPSSKAVLETELATLALVAPITVAATEVVAPIVPPIVPAGTAGGAAAGEAAGAAVRAQTRIQAAFDAELAKSIELENVLKDETLDLSKIEATESAAKRNATAILKSYGDALAIGVTELKAFGAELTVVNNLVLELAASQKATLATPAAVAGTEELTASEAALGTQLANNAKLEALLGRQDLTAAEAATAFAVAKKNEAEATKLFSAALLGEDVELRANTGSALAAAAAAKELAATKSAVVSGKFAEVEQLGAVSVEKLGLAVSAADKKLFTFAEAEARSTAAGEAFTAAQTAKNAAVRLGLKPLIDSTTATFDLAAAEKTAAAETLKLATAQETAAVKQAAALKTQLASAAKQAESSAAREATLLRGAGATGLAAGGLRGATLAASTPFLVGAAAVTVLLKSLQAAGQFETQLNVLQAATHATTAEMKLLSSTALALGKDLTLPAVSSKDAAVALTDLATAGFSIRESIAAARGALLLGVAAQIDTANATEITVKTLDSFGLAGDQATRVANSLTNAARSAEGNIGDFAAALAQVGPVARQGGLSLEQTNAILTVFAKGGLTGAAAGTALRQALVRLENPTSAAAALLKQLGVNIRDAQGNLRPDIFIQVGEAASKFGPAFRDAAFASLFGARAVKAADIAFREGAAGLDKATLSQKNQNAAAELAQAQTKGLSGRFEELKKTVTTLSVDIGNLSKGPVSSLIQGFTASLRGADGLISGLRGIGSALGPVGAIAGTIGKNLVQAFAAGILPVLALVGVYKALKLVIELANVAQARWVGTSEKLVGLEKSLAALKVRDVEATTALAVAQARAAAAAAELAAAEGEAAIAAARLSAAQAAEAVTAAEAAAATTAQAVATTEAAVAAEASAAANLTLVARFTSLLGPIGLAVTGALLLGGALKLLGLRADATKKANDELIRSLEKLDQTRNPHNIAAASFAIDKLSKSIAEGQREAERARLHPITGGVDLKVINATISALEKQIETAKKAGATPFELQGLTDQLAKAKIQQSIRLTINADPRPAQRTTEEFIKQINDDLNKIQFSPRTEHALLLARDFARKLNQRPTEQEFRFILNKASVGTSLRELSTLLQAQGGQLAIDGQRLGDHIAEGVGRGIDLRAPDAIKSSLASAASIAAATGKSLFELIVQAEGTKDKAAKKVIENEITGLISELVALGPAGFTALKGVGQQILEGMAAGITENQHIAIAAANQAFQDAVDAAHQQVESAVSSAKSNLGSLASGLAGAIGNVLDARATAAIAALDKSNLGKEITALTADLNKSQFKQQRASLQFQIATATDDSTRRNAIFSLQQFELQHRLDTDKKIQDSRKTEIQKTADAQKAAVQKNIQAYADAFAKGQISVSDFGKKVLGQIQRDIPDFQTAGKSMAATFQPVKEQLDGIIAQAKALAGFTGLAPGGTNQQNIVDVGKVAAQAQLDIASALKTRGETLAKINLDSRNYLKLIKEAMQRISPPGAGNGKTKTTTGSGQTRVRGSSQQKIGGALK